MEKSRRERLIPNEVPRYVRIYDNGGETADRYTVVFTKKRMNKGCFAPPYHRGQFLYIGMGGSPFHPQGFCQHGESQELIDRPTSSHLGKRIKFDDLPDDCKKVVLDNYTYLWDIQ